MSLFRIWTEISEKFAASVDARDQNQGSGKSLIQNTTLSVTDYFDSNLFSNLRMNLKTYQNTTFN
jgi:hypothetical protein